MTASLQQARKYAQLKGTKVIEAEGGYRVQDDGSITFVMESGPKLNMTEKELNAAIAQMEEARETERKVLEVQSEPGVEKKSPKAKKE